MALLPSTPPTANKRCYSSVPEDESACYLQHPAEQSTKAQQPTCAPPCIIPPVYKATFTSVIKCKMTAELVTHWQAATIY